MELEEAVKIAKSYLGVEYFKDLNIEYVLNGDTENFKVRKVFNNVLIEYGQLVHIFRALTMLKERHSQSNFEESFYQKFITNGLMVDVSRNGVLKNEKVKELILINALMGLNRFLLYTEDTFVLEKYPYFGYLRGAYSKEDLKEFVSYAKSFGVEIVPCIQTLGHMRQALKWAPLDYLRDGPDTLLVDSPKVYAFIEDVVKFCRECFNSKEIHIGMDESLEMGLNRHLLIHGYESRLEMFDRHLREVRKICNKYDFSPMIWSDMYFRLNSETNEYYIDKPLPQRTLEGITKNIKLVYWDYYHNSKENYIRMLKYHKETKNPVVFASGAWRWTGFAPAIEKSIENGKAGIEASIAKGVRETFVTTWGDDGNEASFFSVIPQLAASSVISYSSYNKEEIDSLVKAITNDTLEDFFALDLPNEISDEKTDIFYNPCKYLFYQDILLGIFDSEVKENYAQKYKKFAAILEEKANKCHKYSYVYLNLANLCKVLEIKSVLGIELRKAYKENNKKKLSDLFKTMDELKVRVQNFHQSFERQWMNECRPFGYEVMDGRFGIIESRIAFTQKRINDYLEGKIEKIEELEADILPFDGKKDPISWNWWYRTISPSN